MKRSSGNATIKDRSPALALCKETISSLDTTITVASMAQLLMTKITTRLKPCKDHTEIASCGTDGPDSLSCVIDLCC